MRRAHGHRTVTGQCVLPVTVCCCVGEGQTGAPVKVDDMLTKFLRAHQREGLQFLFDCVCGLKSYEGQGWCGPACVSI